jgi:translation initiation factor 2B subunit (eIF-2B alpha/beta/delta family)
MLHAQFYSLLTPDTVGFVLMDWIGKKIQEMVNDRRHGAAQLASSAIRILMAVCQRSEPKDLKGLTLTIKQTALSLAQARPSMAPIRNWSLVFAQRFIEKINAGFSIREAKRHGVVLGKELLALQQELIHQQVEAARTVIRNCKSVVTLSYSSTVESILRHGLPPGCRVVIAESRPLMEGRRLFRNLSDDATELGMITDAQMGLAIPAADLVLVGADAVLRDLSVVNKTGTYLAALVAHAHDRDFLVAADTYKINVTMDSHNCILEAKSGREVWSRQEKHCDNVYFDITPRELITGFISEAGFLDAAGMREHAQRWQRLEKDLAL